ncbi:MAG: 50S ribosomal protein L11 [bacterium]
MANEKKVKALIKLQVPAGKANPAPPVGPALGQHGLNIMDFCNEFNNQTRDKAGDVIPVEISVYEDRTFTLKLKSPPASTLILKKVNQKKGSNTPNTKSIGTITIEDLKEIAKVKMQDLNAYDEDSAIEIIRGTAKSMGVNVQ